MASGAGLKRRLLLAALWRRRGMVAVALAAVALATAMVEAAWMVSRDVSRKLSSELRALGPNLVLTPEHASPGGPLGTRTAGGFVDERELRRRLLDAGLDGAVLLYALVEVQGRPVTVVGADLDALRRLHPSWSLPLGPAASFLGARLMDALGVETGEPLRLENPATGNHITLPAGARLSAGAGEDQAWWIPLDVLQRLTGLEGRASLAQARVEGDASQARVILERMRGPGIEPRLLHALASSEAMLLDRVRRLMTLIAVTAMLAASLCAFGTLTDLALERRHEVALCKALGASREDLVRQFGAESLAIGLAGGVLGVAAGWGLAQLVGWGVFESAIRFDPWVAPAGVALSVLVAMAAATGPVRLALAVEPAPALAGEG